MMIRLAVVVFSLLASAATVHAECAWVLWGRQVDRTWEPHITLTSQKECEKVLEESRPHLRGTSLICLPDTVDPRGPRGK